MNRAICLAAAVLIAATGCGGPLASGTAHGMSPQGHVRHLKGGRGPLDVLGGAPSFRLFVALYDAPLAGASAFDAGILGVDAVDADGNSWQLVGNAAPQVVDLLTLQQEPLELGTGSLPVGTYPSVQLLLDPATTTVTANGQTYPVRFTQPDHPWWDTSATIQAVSVPLRVTGGAGDSLVATLDFNVFQSTDIRDGIAYVTPTVAGGIGSPAIGGSVVNAAGAPVVNATVIATDRNGVVANTAVTAADGSFHIRAIGPGGYTVTVSNASTTNAGVTVTATGNDPGAAPSSYVVVGPNSQVTLPALRD